MMNKKSFLKEFLLVFFLFCFAPLVGQSLEGRVLSAKDSTALPGVSVYFDGTSLGTSTNSEGRFFLKAEAATKIPLVISFLGYETLILNGLPESGGRIPTIYLKEKPEELGEVVLAADPWSRQKKLGIFRREFLGKFEAAADVRIKNEDALELRYNPATDQLTASAKEPLVIINRSLGYRIIYNMESFKVEFSRTEGLGLRNVRMVFYQGTSFFEELRKKRRRKFDRNRKTAFYGSSLHFMRALGGGQLRENDFQIFHEKFEVPPYQFFSLEKHDQGVEVQLLAEKLSILYRGIEQSGIQTTGPFKIDALGNHTPPQDVIFSGEMSGNRIADLLPLDYLPE